MQQKLERRIVSPGASRTAVWWWSCVILSDTGWLFLAMMNKPVRNPTSSFSLNMFNKIDTVSECAWVSVTNVPESSFSQRAESYAHRLEAVKTALGFRLNSWWWLVSWSIGSCVCVLTWLTEQWDSSGLLYRITSFVPKGSILMMSPNVLPSGVSFQQVSWGRGYDSAVLNSFSTVWFYFCH